MRISRESAANCGAVDEFAAVDIVEPKAAGEGCKLTASVVYAVGYGVSFEKFLLHRGHHKRLFRQVYDVRILHVEPARGDDARTVALGTDRLCTAGSVRLRTAYIGEA